ncbi:putative deoxyribonuclease YcfH [compost metagenome]
MFLPNVDSGTIQHVFDLATKYPENCFPMMGLHPCSVKDNYEKELTVIKQAIDANKIYAIGEIGIDLYWDKTHLEEQKKAFKTQIGWAKELNLPIVIHCRDAYNEIIEVLEEEKDEKLRGIFHCFGGSVEQAQKVINLNFYLGIGGVVTYKNSGLDKTVAAINPEHIVLETDAPYLTPVPYRGKPNETSYLVHIAQKVADLYQMDIVKLAKITTENSVKIFGV